jgi:hypothetical protein
VWSVDFFSKMTAVLVQVDGIVPPSARVRPSGHEDSSEWDLRAFCRGSSPEGFDVEPLDEWWASKTYRGPTWDLLAECSIAGRPGYILVEAKAHESELQRQGKPADVAASDQSKTNHRRIAECLERSQEWFRSSVDRRCRICVDSHYQLANRLSAAETLASCGVPVVLLYLGFTGDTYFRDYLKDDSHWQRVMGAYLDGVVPLSWPGTTTLHRASGGSVTLLIRTLPAMEVSTRMSAGTEP